ncbi:MAG: hypothetical protein E7345_01080 [Clostridiales bacterium]|nr:hypothetical protein [Clostridiales bacterium]
MSEYLFDKRKMKRSLLKYLIIFSISFVPVVLFNVYVGTLINSRGWVIFLDCILMLAFVVLGNYIAGKIFERKDRKLKAKIKEREKLQERKNKILEDSYKAKRKKKLEDKQQKTIKEEENGNTEK